MKFSMFHRAKRSLLLPAAIAGVLGFSVLFATGAAAQPAGRRRRRLMLDGVLNPPVGWVEHAMATIHERITQANRGDSRVNYI